jgi:hypothetical protein
MKMKTLYTYCEQVGRRGKYYENKTFNYVCLKIMYVTVINAGSSTYSPSSRTSITESFAKSA